MTRAPYLPRISSLKLAGDTFRNCTIVRTVYVIEYVLYIKVNQSDLVQVENHDSWQPIG